MEIAAEIAAKSVANLAVLEAYKLLPTHIAACSGAMILIGRKSASERSPLMNNSSLFLYEGL